MTGRDTANDESKQINQSTLYRMILSSFSEEELRTLSGELAIDYADLGGEGREHKARELLAYLERRNRSSEIVKIVQQKRPKIYWEAVFEESHTIIETENHIEEVLTLPRVPFTNREDEKREILSSFAPPYYLLDAPAGYGKTDLLQALKQRFDEEGWVCAHVSIEERQTLNDLVETLAKELNLNARLISSRSIRERIPLEVCFSSELRKSREKDITKEGLVLLIDLEKRPALLIVKELLEKFIPEVHRNLQNLKFFAVGHNRFRIILSGRSLAGRRETKEAKLPLKPLRLSPFDYDVIRDSAKRYLDDLPGEDIDQISAHLLYLTGGHPGCMAQALEKYKAERIAPYRFLEIFGQEIWENNVQKTVQYIRRDLLDSFPKLSDALEKLSIFRYLDHSILERMIKSGEIAEAGDEFNLADELTATYLLDWKVRLLRDDITRRLLVIGIRHDLVSAAFAARCQQARDMCAKHMQEPHVQMPEMWAIEYLFQSLQQYAPVIYEQGQSREDSRNRRKDIRNEFFTNDVPKVLNVFLRERNVPSGARRWEHNALNQVLEEDWEFRFTVNYYLRERNDQYDDEPFNELQLRIARFFD